MAIIGIVGLGTMGLGIAQVFATAGHQVHATDSHPPARDTAKARITLTLGKRLSAGKLTQSEVDATLSRITISENLTDLKDCHLVIEAIAETHDAKQALFSALEPMLSKTAVLATNTSALSIGALAKSLARPERLLGLHFFNPAPAMPLVELVTRPSNAENAVAFAKHIAETAGKTVIECADRPGFIVNRCARPFYGEALAMLEEGFTAADIDAAMLYAGYRIGPFSLIDLIGADINLAATKALYAAMEHHPRYYIFQTLIDQVAAGRLGTKTGCGFLTGVAITAKRDDSIALRIEATLANEAASLLQEGGQSVEVIDFAMKRALNYPRGPFEALKHWGTGTICDELARLERSAPAQLKMRYSPSLVLAAL